MTANIIRFRKRRLIKVVATLALMGLVVVGLTRSYWSSNSFRPGSEDHANEYQHYPDRCYSYRKVTSRNRLRLLDKSHRQKLGCSQKLPGAIVIGVKKGGTAALRFFLQYHPEVSYSPGEVRYFDSKKFQFNMETYRKLMAYSTREQVTVEGTPSYFTCKTAARRIKAAMPNVKLILLLRDPVGRAISDYAHVKDMMSRPRNYSYSKSRPDIENGSRYEISSSFADSVLYRNANLKTYNLILLKGRYVDFLSRWLKYFPLERILILDSGSLSKKPLPTLKKVEEYLGITPYFTSDHFKFVENKGFYCLDKPVPNNCMTSDKGRPHAQVNETVLQLLQDYYDPFNKKLNKVLNRTFDWSI